MQVNKSNAKYQEPKLKPLNYKEFVKISGDRTIEIKVTNLGSVKIKLIKNI